MGYEKSRWSWNRSASEIKHKGTAVRIRCYRHIERKKESIAWNRNAAYGTTETQRMVENDQTDRSKSK